MICDFRCSCCGQYVVAAAAAVPIIKNSRIMCIFPTSIVWFLLLSVSPGARSVLFRRTNILDALM